jgi:methylmalonyl-CoA mutase N-terminal domain/subunit
LPTEQAVEIAVRTQQVLAYESGVCNTIDPLGGSYFIEALTDRMEQDAYDYFRRIDELGGMVEAIKSNFPQREIADASFRYQQEVDAEKRLVVGVNSYQTAEQTPIDILRIDPTLERKQNERLNALRGRRDTQAVETTLAALKEAASAGRNLMEPLIGCARANSSEGEIIAALQEVFGSYTETPVF